MKVMGITLETELASNNGYIRFGDVGAGQRQGAAEVSDMEAFHVGGNGFTAEAWLRLDDDGSEQEPSDPMMIAGIKQMTKKVADAGNTANNLLECGKDFANNVVNNVMKQAKASILSVANAAISGLEFVAQAFPGGNADLDGVRDWTCKHAAGALASITQVASFLKGGIDKVNIQHVLVWASPT